MKRRKKHRKIRNLPYGAGRLAETGKTQLHTHGLTCLTKHEEIYKRSCFEQHPDARKQMFWHWFFAPWLINKKIVPSSILGLLQEPFSCDYQADTA
ncbi:hypothetical protein [Streptococcus sp. DD11]|uniref:hypothetical protein n=1 Tax=Streptococcus sp. DD11 TaxID=1777879 RepID=UPI0010082175|nr:hypothetical protein [Streptococcus sp. DD11]